MTENEIQTGIQSAYMQALKSFKEGGVPVGSALLIKGAVVALGHNQRIQKGSNVLHGEMDCIENAGQEFDFTQATLFTTLSPCMMCSHTILLFGIPRVVILDNHNTDDFETNMEILKERGVEVTVIEHQPSIDLNHQFQTNSATRKIWLGDIGE